jgi:hypothetical protein
MAAGTGHHVEDLPGGGSHVTQGVTGGRFEGWDKDHGVSRGGIRPCHVLPVSGAGMERCNMGGSCKALPERQERERRLGERACHLATASLRTGPYPRDVPVMRRSRLPVSVRPESPLGRALTGRTSKLRIFPPFRNNALYFMAVWVGRAGVRAADGCRGPGGFRLVAVSRGGMGAICDL